MNKKALFLLLAGASYVAMQADVPTTVTTTAQPTVQANTIGKVIANIKTVTQSSIDTAKLFGSRIKTNAIDYTLTSKTYLCNLYNQSTKNQRIVAGVTAAVVVGTAGYLMWKHFHKKGGKKR